MKLSKYLVFKIKDYLFAIKTREIINILEKVRIYSKDEAKKDYFFVYKGMNIPYIDLYKILGCEIECNKPVPFILIIDIKINNKNELIGIPIDEVVEITEIDDFMSYPFMQHTKVFSIKEAIVNYKNSPLIIINTDKMWNASKFDKNLVYKEYYSN